MVTSRGRTRTLLDKHGLQMQGSKYKKFVSLVTMTMAVTSRLAHQSSMAQSPYTTILVAKFVIRTFCFYFLSSYLLKLDHRIGIFMLNLVCAENSMLFLLSGSELPHFQNLAFPVQSNGICRCSEFFSCIRSNQIPVKCKEISKYSKQSNSRPNGPNNMKFSV